MTEKYWYKMLKSRCRKSNMTWEKFNKLKEYYCWTKAKMSAFEGDKMTSLAMYFLNNTIPGSDSQFVCKKNDWQLYCST